MRQSQVVVQGWTWAQKMYILGKHIVGTLKVTSSHFGTQIVTLNFLKTIFTKVPQTVQKTVHSLKQLISTKML